MKIEIDKLSHDWIVAMEKSNESTENNDWSVDHVMDLPYEEKYDELWQFIKYTCKNNINEKVIGCLAAGPLEDLLVNTGEDYIKEIEVLARQEPKFKHLLGGVWQNSMSKELWLRVCNARGNAW